MNIEEKFQRIDQSKLTDSQKKILADLKKGTKNFKTDDDAILAKAEKNLDVIIEKLKEKNPDAIKSSASAPAKTSGSNRLFDIAKDIRKPNETWKDALVRAKDVQKKNNEAVQKTMSAEMAKLLDFVKNRKELDGISGTTIKKDAKLEARVKGRRVAKAGWKNQYGESKGGRVYYENRDNRSDRLAPSYPNKNYKLQAGGNLSTADIAGVPTAKTIGGGAGTLDGVSGTQYTDLVGETGALSAGELFAKGGRLKSALMRDRKNYNHFEDHENRYSKGKPHRKGYGYAKGGALYSHGLEVGDTIIKTLSRGVQKIKTKDGKTMYVDLSNGYRDTTPPLPFENGGDVKKKVRWQDVESGDMARVIGGKSGVVIQTYGRKFHIKFVDDTEKTYDASELEFFKDPEDNYAKGGSFDKKEKGVKEGDLIKNEGKFGARVTKVNENTVEWLDKYAEKKHCKKSDLILSNTDDYGEDDGYYEDEPNSWVLKKSYAKGGMVVTKVSDIPNFKKNLDEGKITYRGLGMGKLSDDFFDLAGENGTRIKVEGKEYFITDSEFDKFSRDPQTGKMAIKFDAPYRKDYGGEMFAKGGKVLTPRERYVLEISGLTGVKVDAVNKYIDENDLTNDEILNIVVGLGRKQIKNGDVSTAIIGTKNNSASKEVIEFAKGDRAMRLAKGGKLPSCKKTAKHRADN